MTNQPPVPQSRVGWSLGSFEKEFWRKYSSVIGLIKPSMAGRLFDLFTFSGLNTIEL